jgi:spore coat polysaccharide biosynthesis protein SpsF
MGSTRLPGKVMLDLCGKPVLWHVADRLRHAKLVDRIVVATTDLPEDDIIYESALEWGVDCARGSSTDVLSRYFAAAEAFPCEAVARVTSDCPLIDPGVCDEVIGFYWRGNGGCQYVSNSGADLANRSYPRGLDCEVFSAGLLAEAHRNAAKGYEREHVTPYMYWNNASVHYYKYAEDLSGLRWTLDTPEDYELISLIYKELYRQAGSSAAAGGAGNYGAGADGSPPFSWLDALAVYDAHPEWAAINSNVEQKQIQREF